MTELLTKYLPNVANLGWGGDTGWGTSIWQTIYMTFWPAIFGGLLGLIFGVVLVIPFPGHPIHHLAGVYCTIHTTDRGDSNRDYRGPRTFVTRGLPILRSSGTSGLGKC